MGALGSMFVPDNGDTRHSREAPEASRFSRWEPKIAPARGRCFHLELNGSRARVLVYEDTWGPWEPLGSLIEELLEEALDYDLKNVTVDIDGCDPAPFDGLYEAVETGKLVLFLKKERRRRAERLAQAQTELEAAVAARRPYYQSCKKLALRSLEGQGFTAADIAAAEARMTQVIQEKIEFGMSNVETELHSIAWRAASSARQQREQKEHQQRERQQREQKERQQREEAEAPASAGGPFLKRSQQIAILSGIFRALPGPAQRRNGVDFESKFQLIVSSPTTTRTAAEVRKLAAGWK